MNKFLVVLLIFIAVCVIAYLMYNRPEALRQFFGGRGRLSLVSQEPWFSEVKAGRKTVEARAGPPDIYQKNIGKKIEISIPKGEKVFKVIKAVRHYKTLEEFVQGEGWKKVAPHVKSEAEAVKAFMTIKNKAGETVYDAKNIAAKGGVTAIEIE